MIIINNMWGFILYILINIHHFKINKFISLLEPKMYVVITNMTKHLKIITIKNIKHFFQNVIS